MNDSDASDDGVMFEGSPLHECLVAAGVAEADYEAEARFQPRPLKSIEEIITGSTDSPPNKTVSGEGYIRRMWIAMLKHILLCVHTIWDSQHTHHDSGQYDLLTADQLMRSGVLEEEDASFLQRYTEVVEVVQGPAVGQEGHRGIGRWSAVLGLPCLTAYIIYRLYWAVVWPLHTATDCLALGVAVWLLAEACTTLLHLQHRGTCQARRHAVIKFVGVEEDLLNCLRKSLRLIQERELVARGFTIVSQRAAASCLEEGVATSQRQCPELRQLVFTTARDTLLAVREATQTLLLLQPLSAELDMPCSYLAFEPLENYGACLKLPALDDHDPARSGDPTQLLLHLTDGFSVASIQGMIALLSLHQSEMVKRLALIFYVTGRQKVSIDMAGIVTLVGELTSRLDQQAATLRRFYDFHRCSLPDAATPTHRPAPPTPYSSTQVALHSLDLHLQAALTRLRSLTSSMGECGGGGNVTAAAVDDTLTDRMASIRAELDACRGCWEEGLLCVERLQGKQNSASTYEPADQTASDGPGHKGDSSHSSAKPIEEHIILDQVFEAYTDPAETDTDDMAWHELLSPEEKEKRKREKEEAMRLLTELKSVISVRAVQRQLRELEAVRRDNPQMLEQTPLSDQLDSRLEHNLTKPSKEQCGDVLSDGSDGVLANDLHLDKEVLVNSSEYNREETNDPVRVVSEHVEQTTVETLSYGDSDSEIHSDDDSPYEQPPFRLHPPTLKDRLGLLTGADLQFSSDIATLAVARSRTMGQCEETTFGDESDDSSNEIEAKTGS